jgi:hypothetical protein
MKLLISVAAVAVLAAGSSFAQTSPEAPAAPPPEVTAPGDTPPLPAPETDADRDQRRMERRAERQREREMRWHRKMRENGWRGWRHWRDGRDRPEAGAHFRIEVDEDGSMKFDVRCAANEPTQTCADVMMRLFDRLEPGGSTQPPPDDAAPPAQQD